MTKVRCNACGGEYYVLSSIADKSCEVCGATDYVRVPEIEACGLRLNQQRLLPEADQLVRRDHELDIARNKDKFDSGEWKRSRI